MLEMSMPNLFSVLLLFVTGPRVRSCQTGDAA